MTTTIAPMVGDIWEDCDKRAHSRGVRTVKVISVSGEHASVRVYLDGHETARVTSVQVKRFRPNATGYKLVERDGKAVT